MPYYTAWDDFVDFFLLPMLAVIFFVLVIYGLTVAATQHDEHTTQVNETDRISRACNDLYPNNQGSFNNCVTAALNNG